MQSHWPVAACKSAASQGVSRRGTLAPTFYKILGVRPGADAKKVKSAYRRLIRRFHPDLNADDPGAEKCAKDLNRAYQTLKHPETRAAYDQELTQQRSLMRRRFWQSMAAGVTACILSASFVLLVAQPFLFPTEQQSSVREETPKVVGSLDTKTRANSPERPIPDSSSADADEPPAGVAVGSPEEPPPGARGPAETARSEAKDVTPPKTAPEVPELYRPPPEAPATAAPQVASALAPPKAAPEEPGPGHPRAEATAAPQVPPSPAGPAETARGEVNDVTPPKIAREEPGHPRTDAPSAAAERGPPAAPDPAETASPKIAVEQPLPAPASAPLKAKPANWMTYRDARFGFALNYPADVFTSAAGDGADAGERLLLTKDGRALLRISATSDAAASTLTEYRRALMQGKYRGATFDYTPVRGNWFVLSGTAGEEMFYERVTFSCDRRTLHRWLLVYPLAEKAFFDRIVEEVHRSYRYDLGGRARCNGATSVQTPPDDVLGKTGAVAGATSLSRTRQRTAGRMRSHASP